MIGISKLYCGTVQASDPLRYGRHSKNLPSNLLQFSRDKKPVVVWNCTKRCNLSCQHCYSASNFEPAPTELSDTQAKEFISDIAKFGSPVLLFSGGEPLMRPGVLDLIRYAKSQGLRAVVSTNGTLISADLAQSLNQVGLSYAGISLDGATAEINDQFRGVDGAFERALEGIRNCISAGVKVGLRFTINQHNAEDIDGIFDLLERENIPRVCFYHLVAAGRGTQISDQILPADQTRHALDRILARAKQAHESGRKLEVLTVDNHADGAYLYMKLLQQAPQRAAEVLSLLKMNGGNSSGVGIGCVSWDGTVHPDQFWRNQNLGNVTKTPFSEIWTSPKTPLLPELRDRKSHLQDRCQRCRFLSICNGNLRVRSEISGNGIWGDDPSCYLTDEEISGELL